MGAMNESVNAIKLDSTMGMVVLLLAILAPGISTCIAGVLSKDDEQMKNGIIVGIIQFLLLGVCIGWIWALLSGWKIYSNSK